MTSPITITGELKIIQEADCTFVPKGWGWERWLVNNDKYCGKILHFYEGKKLSWHYHNLKCEHFACSFGKVIIKYSWRDSLEEAEEVVLEKGMVFAIPTGLRHQVIALEESELIEISTTHFEDDSIRLVKGD